MKIAILLTCHDRKEKTLKCLHSLYSTYKNYDTYLVDDGCTDGTPEAVMATFHNVHIIKGNGNLFWSRGMYTAWKVALKHQYDFYLWLNDDTVLYPFFMEYLISSYEKMKGNCIVVGLIGNIFNKEEVIYGGYDSTKRLITESQYPKEITYMNGNVVLVPKEVVKKIGIIDSVFHHDLGDVDYGLTAIEHGIKVVTSARIIALGYPNNYCRVRKWGTTLCKRIKKLNSPLGSPLNINFYYRKKHFGLMNALIYCTYLIYINLLPDKVVEKLWGNKYKDESFNKYAN